MFNLIFVYLHCLGDGGCGKTVLLCAYTEKDIQLQTDDYIPTVLDTYSAALKVGERDVALEIFDTAGQEDFAHIRKAVYPSTDVFILCYSVVNRASLDNIEKFWSIETKLVKPKAPAILAGNKLDLKDVKPHLYCTPEIAEETRLKIDAQAQVQCSAKEEALRIRNDGMVDKIFKFAIKFGLQINRKKKGCCCSCLML